MNKVLFVVIITAIIEVVLATQAQAGDKPNNKWSKYDNPYSAASDADRMHRVREEERRQYEREEYDRREREHDAEEIRDGEYSEDN